jgi:uncharacterized protein (TIGR03083 family)
VDLWTGIREERLALVADLELLAPAQWDEQSLCSEWRVRDVVAHLGWAAAGVGIGETLRGVVASRGNFHRWSAELARRRGSADPQELLVAYRGLVDARKTPVGAKPLDMFCDTIIHGQDIRRPLGLHRDFPADRIAVALDHLKTNSFPFKAKMLIAGLRLVGTDQEWTSGDGPEVRGTGEALLLAMGGRSAATADLSGPGREILESRL